ncbi:STAS domain-containing protein [bacterium]|nr:MAG: anti-sigma factor antagonist [candidate division KSB1 bacterium]MCE7945027.1 anti-sigma factor antagonist [Chlorobi bacterium CHB1]MCL4708054.1 STAS domain-containing protein [bacterium]MDL1874653.1 STAS domain-containing protein [Cytophagia bacterium CHB2]MBC6950717.1 anti-sigma factor antagonist [candidate division KSB1 bacterium]
MKVERLAGGKVVIIEPKTSLIGNDETFALRDTLHRLRDEGNMLAVINLNRVPYLNSTGIGILVAAHSDYERRGGRLCLCGLRDSVDNVLVITKLSQVFEVYPNQEEALASMAKA